MKREPPFAGGTDDDFLVHADRLAERGDPRGELIHIQHALASRPKDRKLRAAQAKLLANPKLAPPAKLRGNVLFRPKLTWRLGFVDTAVIRWPEPDIFAAIVDPPS